MIEHCFERYGGFKRWSLSRETVSLGVGIELDRLTLFPVHSLLVNVEAICLVTVYSCHLPSCHNVFPPNAS